MFYYPNILARYEQSDPASYAWICIEEVKRFNLALYRVCRALSRSSNSCTANSLLRAEELHFPMPENDLLWNAMTGEEWTSAMAEGANRDRLDGSREENWISHSAELLQIFGTDFI